jgi:hypothetical protein
LSDKIDPAFKEWLIKQKLSYSIGALFLVRFHAALILAAALLAGWTANRLLFLAGVTSMLTRHPLAVLEHPLRALRPRGLSQSDDDRGSGS